MSAINRDTVLNALRQRHVGEANGISCSALVSEIGGLLAVDGDERRLRKMIEELRRDGFWICGLPESGYFFAADEAELKRACGFLYSRSMTGLEQIAAMMRKPKPDFRAELGLS